MSESNRPSREEIVARFDRLFAKANASDTDETRSLIARIGAASRAEAMAAAERLVAIGELFAARLRTFGETEDWAVDTTEVVASEVAAELRISQAMGISYLRYARAMREQLPQSGAVFRSGDIDFRMFQTLVYRTDLITDRDVLAAVDAELALAAPRWPSMTQGRLAAQVDKIVWRADRDAVRRRREAIRDREVWISDRHDGLSDIHGTLLTPYAHALGKRLAGLAATVCDADPRTADQRRSDAVGALAAGADRLDCQCGQDNCPAGGKAAGPVVIHVITDQAALEGRSSGFGSEVGANALIPPEQLTELAKSAKVVPVIHPSDAPAECGRTPSRALADFVRCRDMTCRFPGCDRPATCADIDHTIPSGDGGATHASDLKCLCRLHHLLKTFWGWRDEQLRDGTVIWTSPSGEKYVTTPGSALLFPSLCQPTGVAPVGTPEYVNRCGDRTAMMPGRARTRAQNRAQRIAAERRLNRTERQLQSDPVVDYFNLPPPNPDDPPPPF
ncbi:HNH endonuclease signature motif containing protein [Mycobacterium sp. URHB0021]